MEHLSHFTPRRSHLQLFVSELSSQCVIACVLSSCYREHARSTLEAHTKHTRCTHTRNHTQPHNHTHNHIFSVPLSLSHVRAIATNYNTPYHWRRSSRCRCSPGTFPLPSVRSVGTARRGATTRSERGRTRRCPRRRRGESWTPRAGTRPG